MTTALIISLFAGIFFAAILLWALFLRLGLRWAKIPDVTWSRVVITAILVGVIQVLIAAVPRAFSPSSSSSALMLTTVQLGAAILVPCWLIMGLFRTSLLRAFQAWLPTLLASVGAGGLVLLLLRPLVVETFTAPTNSMAPTLLGDHWEGKCPECGGPAFGSPIPAGSGLKEQPLMICRDHFHIGEATDYSQTVQGRDHFLVLKCLRPRRWDLVVYRYPEQPSVLYVKRLVGLPGEVITIQNGRVLANGEPLVPPESLRELKYQSGTDDWHIWGDPDRPASLGKDEYFVLGDFTARSKDSRYWEIGAPGHNPYAVPESHLVGVVTHIYWPPSRARSFRK